MEVLSIAANGRDMSFSSDTGMAECLVIARKFKPGETPQGQDRMRFTSLSRRPQGFAHASSLASCLMDGTQVRKIEDGPYGGNPLVVGEELAGELITAPRGTVGESWGAVRVSDYSLAQAAYTLSNSKLWLPGLASSLELNVAALRDMGRRGWHDINIAGASGPFTKVPPSSTATYPALWNHNAKLETRMVCAPDFQLLVKLGKRRQSLQSVGYSQPRPLESRFYVWLPASRHCLHRHRVYRRAGMAKRCL